MCSRTTITVDGNLDDWKGVLPQPVYADGNDQGPSQAVAAWLPFEKFTASQKPGFATGYLAYDDKNFYFAAKIADNTPSPGTIRFATRNDDEYYYPDVSYNVDDKTHVKTAYKWPASVRHYTYRKEDIFAGLTCAEGIVKSNILWRRGWESGSDRTWKLSLAPEACDIRFQPLAGLSIIGFL